MVLARAAAAVNSHGYFHQASTTTEPATATGTAHGNSGRRPRTGIAFPGLPGCACPCPCVSVPLSLVAIGEQ